MDINSLSDVSANMFSHYVGYLFILLMFSFAVLQLFSLMYSHFFFVSLAWEDIADKILPRAVSKILLPMFSSTIFMVWGLTFKSLMHFEVYFLNTRNGQIWGKNNLYSSTIELEGNDIKITHILSCISVTCLQAALYCYFKMFLGLWVIEFIFIKKIQIMLSGDGAL